MRKIFNKVMAGVVTTALVAALAVGMNVGTTAVKAEEANAITENWVNASPSYEPNDAIIANARQLSSVNLALIKAQEAKDALDFGETNDIVCFSLESALSELDMIDARATSEEIVSEIFSRFCVGK